jgi:hypothetical protein
MGRTQIVIGGSVILIWILKVGDGRAWTAAFWMAIGKTFGFIKCRVSFEQLRNN